MNDIKKLQKNDLNNVAGGTIPPTNEITCANCKYEFNPYNVTSQTISKGCDKIMIYKCPKCSVWVYSNGEIYKK